MTKQNLRHQPFPVFGEIMAIFNGKSTFHRKIGHTTYEVTTQFDPAGRESVLRQFQKLILNADLTPPEDSPILVMPLQCPVVNGKEQL